MSGPGLAARLAKLPIAALLTGLGGLLAVLQAALAWEKVTAGPTSITGLAPGTWNGLDVIGGRIVLGLGLATLALAGAWVMKIKLPSPAWLAIWLGVLIAALAIRNWIDRNSDISAYNDQLDLLKELGHDTSADSYSMGPGIYVAFAGGVVATLSGVLGLWRKG
jgi:hypothetical protein